MLTKRMLEAAATAAEEWPAGMGNLWVRPRQTPSGEWVRENGTPVTSRDSAELCRAISRLRAGKSVDG